VTAVLSDNHSLKMMQAVQRRVRTACLVSMFFALSIGASQLTAGQAGVRLPPQPSDLLVHSPLAPCESINGDSSDPKRIRVATWNIRAARSAPLDDIGAEISAMQADVIALQEVDVVTRRSGFVDEPAVLAKTLGFDFVFAASIKWDEGDYGLAVLSRWPLTGVKRHRLDASSAIEPRIVLEVAICPGGRPLRLFNYHADGWPGSRETGFSELRGILQPAMASGFLVFGDFNEQPDGAAVRAMIESGLVDLGADLGARVEGRRRIDYLLADPALARRSSTARVWATDKSDHHAMVADVEW
jgi:endonuclease/exonuclease/phosphatase family metal-dependent hydrolase